MPAFRVCLILLVTLVVSVQSHPMDLGRGLSELDSITNPDELFAPISGAGSSPLNELESGNLLGRHYTLQVHTPPANGTPRARSASRRRLVPFPKYLSERAALGAGQTQDNDEDVNHVSHVGPAPANNPPAAPQQASSQSGDDSSVTLVPRPTSSKHSQATTKQNSQAASAKHAS
ncbi:hypothetical protein WOLCODRAFT_149468 [Wolfiporia cocos MD-104 SS10]|uniref:Uncharacterized protein n=1 Tax=Wolfiporia cocos (strain MD-104) TaxID=742152 RepID=A0A2H3JPH8_WOLCO|nr:hypothetical protein WOLCODRAFT_149468 [Wolfiporia cocos MD-104 SS10]